MTKTRYLKKLIIIPEDDKCQKLARGFFDHLYFKLDDVHIEDPVGGWQGAYEIINKKYAGALLNDDFPIFLIIIDQDGFSQDERHNYIKSQIINPGNADIDKRILFIGFKNESDKLITFAGGGKPEDIGMRLADECVKREHGLWESEQLSDNHDNILKFIKIIYKIIYSKKPSYF